MKPQEMNELMSEEAMTIMNLSAINSLQGMHEKATEYVLNAI